MSGALADPHRNAEHEAMAHHALAGKTKLAQDVLHRHLESFADEVFIGSKVDGNRGQ